MSLSDRRAILLSLALLPLSGCGFRPAYGTGGAAKDLRGQVRVADPKNRNEYKLVARLEERLGAPQTHRYDLSFSLRTREESGSVTVQQEITRYNIIGELDFRLIDRSSGAVASSGTVKNFTGYSATGTTVTTLTSQENAYDRLMVMLADQLVARLLAAADRRGS